jgi:exodeoxyribonuclease V gamma subunit
MALTVPDRTDIEPGLRLFTSNHLEILADRLADALRVPLASPFAVERLVTQSQGMARWLKMELARRRGVCANARFDFPNAFASDAFLALFPDLPADTPYDRESMLWAMLRRLPALLPREDFAALDRYLRAGGGQAALRRRFQLARRVAHLFDQYLLFRPDMMLAWDAGRDEDGEGRPLEPGQRWQPVLWREVKQDFPPRHPAVLRRDFLRAMEQPEAAVLARLPQRLSLFGVSALPPFHLDLCAALGRHRQVNLFLLQPSREYWGHITSEREGERILRRLRRGAAEAEAVHLESGNRLLASLGPLGRDFLNLALEAGDWIGDEEFEEPVADTVLHRVQSDILNLRECPLPSSLSPTGAPASGTASMGKRTHAVPEAGAPVHGEDGHRAGEGAALPAEPDDSIQVHVCHSPQREIEVLYDHLLDWFQRDPSLTPRDVLVMTPDIDAYGPFIQAVFESPEDERRRILFSLADRAPRGSGGVIAAFLRLLELADSRLGSASVLGLLEMEPVRRRFGLEVADLDTLRRWVMETNIRWGRDESHRAALGLPALRGNTWRQGLDRLLLGFAMSGGGDRDFAGLPPAGGVEGETKALGGFLEFLERLFATLEKFRQAHPPGDWSRLLLDALNGFLAPDETDEREFQLVRDAVLRLRRLGERAGFSEAVDLGTVLEQLSPALEEDRFGHGFLSGGVTFASLKPMRSLPFRVVCLVGMNDGAFPRATPHLGFDLLACAPRPGDRSTREDDRYLFLETLLSARERLYLSYTGRSLRDNRTLPPSVLVDELLDYLDQRFAPPTGGGRSRFLTEHRLQAFSEAYFSGGRLFSYSGENCRAGEALRRRAARDPRGAFLAEPLTAPDAEFREVSLKALADFLCHPAKFFLARRLNVSLPGEHEAPEEKELLQPDSLEAYSLKQSLLEGTLAGEAPDRMRALIEGASRLPLGASGRAQFEEWRATVTRFAGQLAPFHPGHRAAPLDFECDFDVPDAGAFRLAGVIDGPAPAGPLAYRCAALKAKDLLRLWAQHLAWNVLTPGGASVLAGEDGWRRFPPQPDARAILADLLALYWQGLCAPLKFFPQASLAFAEAALAAGSDAAQIEKARRAAQRAWEGSEYHRAESQDDWNELAFRAVNPLDEEFEAVALRVFGPMLAGLEQGKFDSPRSSPAKGRKAKQSASTSRPA